MCKLPLVKTYALYFYKGQFCAYQCTSTITQKDSILRFIFGITGEGRKNKYKSLYLYINFGLKVVKCISAIGLK